MEGGFPVSINFFDRKNEQVYANRKVDDAWMALIGKEVQVKDKVGVDIGCGGGIYTEKLLQLGARRITAFDQSPVMLDAAKDSLGSNEKVNFKLGKADQTGFPNQSFDFLLTRAVIHHISQLNPLFKEMKRIVRGGGSVIIQDRTEEDCFLPGSATHLRGYFFSLFPRLKEIEKKRRHSSYDVREALTEAGFKTVREQQIWEARAVYESFGELAHSLRTRQGRSILFELTDEEIEQLISKLKAEWDKNIDVKSIVDRDRWTIWFAEC